METFNTETIMTSTPHRTFHIVHSES